jgi:putative membrane protein
LQPILGGLWLLFLLRRLKVRQGALRKSLRLRLAALVGTFWMGGAIMLFLGWQPGTYVALELFWALPPIGLQLAFGADILWRHRRLLLSAIVPLTVFLSTADAMAINWGTWTINPAKSLNIQVGGILPLEEILFFLLTNILVTFGLTLIWAEVSHVRLLAIKRAVLSTTVFKLRAGTNERNETIGRAGDLRLR